jgi:dTDP-glucose pyrophosphorylase
MLNVVVPMAGRGSRFANAGYALPKPLIDVGGKPMIAWVIDNVRPAQEHQFIFICLAEHLVSFPEVPDTLRRLCPGCKIIEVNEVTEGAACTVLLARQYIDNDDPLMIANADQCVRLDINKYLQKMENDNAAGMIMTFWSNHPKWSYCRINTHGMVTAVVEKEVVSNDATVGIYNFRKGRDFVRCADSMIAKNLRVNNEFYVAPTYNELALEGAQIGILDTGREYDGMYGLGTPGDLEYFLTTEVFLASRVTGELKESSNADLIRNRTTVYARFFQDKNVPGLRAILHKDATLTDPSVNLVGRDKIITFLQDLYQQFDELVFSVQRIIVEQNTSIIEFSLKLGVNEYIGVDVIDWDNQRHIRAITAYLYSDSTSRERS